MIKENEQRHRRCRAGSHSRYSVESESYELANSSTCVYRMHACMYVLYEICTRYIHAQKGAPPLHEIMLLQRRRRATTSDDERRRGKQQQQQQQQQRKPNRPSSTTQWCAWPSSCCPPACLPPAATPFAQLWRVGGGGLHRASKKHHACISVCLHVLYCMSLYSLSGSLQFVRPVLQLSGGQAAFSHTKAGILCCGTHNETERSKGVSCKERKCAHACVCVSVLVFEVLLHQRRESFVRIGDGILGGENGVGEQTCLIMCYFLPRFVVRKIVWYCVFLGEILSFSGITVDGTTNQDRKMQLFSFR